MSNKDFYRAFEDYFRGSRELIKERLSVYLPFVLFLQTSYPNAKVLDIGCGRGEWLELLYNNNIKAKGIDIDEGMLKACHALSLDVKKGDGIAYLQEQKDNSLMAISAFHVVEHISFEELQLFVEESLRVLKPGGILIMETPNPENIQVATEHFYVDPTHLRPIPSHLLAFLPRFYGFSRTKIMRLQESKGLSARQSVTLMQVISGVSSDYAVLAQKKAPKEIYEKCDALFAKEYGLSLEKLSQTFENRMLVLEKKIQQCEKKQLQQTKKTVPKAATFMQKVKRKLKQYTQKVFNIAHLYRNNAELHSKKSVKNENSIDKILKSVNKEVEAQQSKPALQRS